MNIGALILNFLPAALMAVITVIMFKFPPKKPNALYGYRTNRSMKSQQTWEFAQHRSIHYFTIISIILSISGFVMSMVTSLETSQIILYIGWTVLLVALIPMIEKELKQNFTDDGQPRK